MPHLDEGQLHAWLDGELASLDALAAEELERHLATCPECRTRLEEARQIRARAGAILRRAELPAFREPDFAVLAGSANSHSRVQTRQRSGGLRRWRTVAWAASIVLALGLGWFGRSVLLSRSEYAEVEAGPELASSEMESASLEEAVPSPVAAPSPAEESADAPPQVRAEPGAAARANHVPLPQALSAPAEKAQVPPPSAPPPPPLPSASGAAVAKGRVTTAEGHPVAGAQVTIPSVGRGTLTAADGSYSLELPASSRTSGAERLAITARSIGYSADTASVHVEPGGTVTQDFRLEEAVLALDAIVVTGQTVPSARQPTDEGSPAAAWIPVGRAEAERHLGRPLLAVQGLDVTEIAVSRVDGGMVRVVQRLPGGEQLVLVEHSEDAEEQREGDRARAETAVRKTRTLAEPADARAGGVERTALSVRRGRIVVRAEAPISPDSLAALLEKLR